jgi:hypothetical protein
MRRPSRADDHDAFARRDPQVADVERDELRETQAGVEQHDDDRPVPRPRPLCDPEQPALLLHRDRPGRVLRQFLPTHNRPPKPELRVERIQRRERQVHRRRLPPLHRLQMPLVIANRPIPGIALGERVAIDRRPIAEPHQVTANLMRVRLPAPRRQRPPLQPGQIRVEQRGATVLRDRLLVRRGQTPTPDRPSAKVEVRTCVGEELARDQGRR